MIVILNRDDLLPSVMGKELEGITVQDIRCGIGELILQARMILLVDKGQVVVLRGCPWNVKEKVMRIDFLHGIIIGMGK